MTASTFPDSSHHEPRSLLVECLVSRRDIEEMVDRCDSGMADIRSANAIAIALNRRLHSEARGLMSFGGDAWRIRFGEQEFDLPEEVTRWMANWAKGLVGKPFHFHLEVTESLLGAETSELAKRTVNALQAVAAPPSSQRVNPWSTSGRDRKSKRVSKGITLSDRMSA